MTTGATPTSNQARTGFANLLSRAGAAAAAVFQSAPPADERITVLVANGNRAGLVVNGGFGKVVDNKFVLDPALEGIYLLKLMDGTDMTLPDDDQVGRDIYLAQGGKAETVTVTVPGPLVAAFKASVLRGAGESWARLYEGAGGQIPRSSNGITASGLAREAAIVQGVVDKALEKLGQHEFTVQTATERTILATETSYGSDGGFDDGDDDYTPTGTYVSWSNVLPEGGAAPASVVSAAAGVVAAAEDPVRDLIFAKGRAAANDKVTFNEVSRVVVLAANPDAAVGVASLMQNHLRTLVDIQPLAAEGVLLNGLPVAAPAADESDEDRSAGDAPR